MDLHLLQNALSVVTGVELAVSRSAIPIHTPMYVSLNGVASSNYESAITVVNIGV